MQHLWRKLKGIRSKLFSLHDVVKYYRFFLPYVRPHWRGYLFMAFSMLVNVFTALGFAWFLKSLSESALRKNVPEVEHVITIGAVLFVSSILISFFNNYVRVSTVNSIQNHVKTKLFDHVMHLPARFFNDSHSGDILSRLTNDVEIVTGAVGPNLLNLVYFPLMAVAAFVYLARINTTLSLLTLLLGPFAVLSAAIFSRYLRANGRQVQRQLGVMNSMVTEALTGTVIIRAFGLERMFSREYRSGTTTLFELRLKEAKLSGGFQVGSELGGIMAMVLCMGVGSLDVVRGSMTVGGLMAFFSLMQHLVSPFTGVAQQLNGLQRSLAASERVWQVMEEAREPEPSTESVVPVFSSIQLHRVSFSYDGQRDAVSNFSLSIPAGKVIAFVGPSGAGKSTLFNLILSFYQPTSGTISMNHQPYSALGSAVIRKNISYVPQETHLFSGTVLDNLRLGSFSVSDEEIYQAARDANIHDFVLSLPQGYRTQIGERGIRLSGGQKQRISIARALLKNAPILLLDEATSALDSETEVLVKDALERLMENRTTLIIAHRLSTIQHADLIVVMKDGQVIEKGTHYELLADNGLYSRLYELQNDGFKLRRLINE